MYVNEKSVAYDLSLFETAEQRQKNNIVKLPKKRYKAKNKRSISLKLAVTLVAFCTMGLGTVGTLIYNQVQLTELTANINSSSKLLNESEGIYTQMQVKSEANLSLSNVEDYAKNKLGMEKIDPSQIEYVSLSNGDKATVKNSGSFFNRL